MNTAPGEQTGIIGKIIEDGFPVIYSLETDLPAEQIIEALPWLAVIAWQYGATDHNGLPSPELNEQLLALEDAIDAHDWSGVLYRAYGRTGNGLKELVYYTASQDAFLAGINAALAGLPRFPINITFYPDSAWEDLRRLQADFNGKV